jgi:hypothetical protein
VTVGLGILTRNRPALVREVLVAVGQYAPGVDLRLVVGVDHDPGTAEILVAQGFDVVEPFGTGICANRNRLLAELAGCDYIALLEDDHKPTCDGWLGRYVAALQEGVVGVVWRLGDGSGAVQHRRGRVCWRPVLGCPLVVMTQQVYETVGAWNQQAFGGKYGCDDGEWANRAYRGGWTGMFPGLWPGIDDAGTSLVDLPDPPSSDGKSADQRHAETNGNLPLLRAARAGRTPVHLANPEDVHALVSTTTKDDDG